MSASWLCYRGKDKPDLIKEGEWRANALFKGYVSFHINSFYSLMPNAECQMVFWLQSSCV
ncbi:hypothetical protein [Commensalibacter communis]|uniref:hypothetical protein n=1 Tax=Commensalibacter communis TaxID=2972786 RepID=UPI00232F365A|nr:hypothetical protein [Commensalibacter communis]